MATSKRKSQSVSAGITQLQYEEALAKFAKNDAEKCSLEAEMDERITAIRDEYDDDLSIITAEQALLMAVIKGYCVQNKTTLFTEKRSIETLFGKLGFRKSPHALKCLKGYKWEDVVEKLEELLPDYVRTIKEADKEKLLADRDRPEIAAQFSVIGVEVKQDEKFFIELKKEEASATIAA
jgi:phage host-nuclease inhibitor protein Gam